MFSIWSSRNEMIRTMEMLGDTNYLTITDSFLGTESIGKVHVFRRRRFIPHKALIITCFCSWDMICFSDFEKISILGQGGQGIVIAAENKKDGRCYAVKVINVTNSDSCYKYALCELTALFGLKHPNIIRLFYAWIEARPVREWEKVPESLAEQTSDLSTVSNACGRQTKTSQENNSHSMVSDLVCDSQSRTTDILQLPILLHIQMELCRGKTLKEWLTDTAKAREQSRDHQHILNIFYQIVDAVEYIHECGLIHRDLKPANIFFASDDKIKVGDFGLVAGEQADCNEDDTKSTMSGVKKLLTAGIGTKPYMPPEQEERHDYDNKVDIYPLGIILFELLEPMTTDSERSHKIGDLKELIFPLHFCQQYPEEHELLKLILDKDPTNRPTASFIKSVVDQHPRKQGN